MYAAFSVYLLGILFLALGVYRVWSALIQPGRLNWVLLPGTLVAEMAYIFGCLITGGEVRRAKLIEAGAARSEARPGKGGRSGSDGQGGTDAAPKLGFVGPVVAALMTIAACGACILVIGWLLGAPVVEQFTSGPGGALKAAALPRTLPGSTEALWEQVKHHVDLLGRMSLTWGTLRWLDWRVPLFVYLAICLSVRLGPVRRPMRPALVAAIFASAVIALIGAIWKRFDRLMEDLWPLLTYVWTLLLFLLVVTLAIRGLVGLVRAFAGKDRPAGGP